VPDGDDPYRPDMPGQAKDAAHLGIAVCAHEAGTEALVSGRQQEKHGGARGVDQAVEVTAASAVAEGVPLQVAAGDNDDRRLRNERLLEGCARQPAPGLGVSDDDELPGLEVSGAGGTDCCGEQCLHGFVGNGVRAERADGAAVLDELIEFHVTPLWLLPGRV